VEKHGAIINEILQEAVKGTNRKVFFVWGGVEKDVREEIRQIVEKETDAIILASYGTFSTGISIRNLHNVIFASPTKSRIRVLQSIGRGLRLGEFKGDCTLFDIIDDFSIDHQMNTTLDHFQERLSYYVEEKIEYKFYNINIKGSA
jgi:superfamily II DNA or RNA helicase